VTQRFDAQLPDDGRPWVRVDEFERALAEDARHQMWRSDQPGRGNSTWRCSGCGYRAISARDKSAHRLRKVLEAMGFATPDVVVVDIDSPRDMDP
jgi:pimeloyl-ACP methyl ester carboxylesterase